MTLCRPRVLLASLFLLVPALLSARQPNILYLMADDLGAGDLGCYGGKIIKTPRIDQLRSEGLLFTDHYAGSASCAPTRCSLMTGKHTGHAWIRANLKPDLRPKDFTMGEALKESGYATGVIGKWGIGEEGSKGVPTQQGFDLFFGFLNQAAAHRYYPEFCWKNDEKVLYPDNPKKRTHFVHDEFQREAKAFIRENGERPWFLWMAYTIPHVDLDVPEKWKAMYRGKIEETKPYGKPGGQHYRYEEEPHATFAGMVSRLDADVGELLDLLTELGLEKDTLVLFTSDNGPTSAGGADPEFFNGNLDFRDVKFSPYEGGIRVPLIARWPEKIEPDTTSDHISAHWDMFPTFVELAGGKRPEGLDGISMVPLFGGEREQAKHDHLYWELHGGRRGAIQMLRKGNWKAVRKNRSGNPSAPLALYDLTKDIGESQDLSSKFPEVADEIAKIMDSEHTPTVNYDLSRKEPITPKSIKR